MGFAGTFFLFLRHARPPPVGSRWNPNGEHGAPDLRPGLWMRKIRDLFSEFLEEGKDAFENEGPTSAERKLGPYSLRHYFADTHSLRPAWLFLRRERKQEPGAGWAPGRPYLLPQSQGATPALVEKHRPRWVVPWKTWAASDVKKLKQPRATFTEVGRSSTGRGLLHVRRCLPYFQSADRGDVPHNAMAGLYWIAIGSERPRLLVAFVPAIALPNCFGDATRLLSKIKTAGALSWGLAFFIILLRDQ